MQAEGRFHFQKVCILGVGNLPKNLILGSIKKEQGTISFSSVTAQQPWMLLAVCHVMESIVRTLPQTLCSSPPI